MCWSRWECWLAEQLFLQSWPGSSCQTQSQSFLISASIFTPAETAFHLPFLERSLSHLANAPSPGPWALLSPRASAHGLLQALGSPSLLLIVGCPAWSWNHPSHPHPSQNISVTTAHFPPSFLSNYYTWPRRNGFVLAPVLLLTTLPASRSSFSDGADNPCFVN